MKNLLVLLSTFLIWSCGEKQHDLIVKGQIQGLKKGIIYLKKVDDSLLVNVDFLVLNGSSYFELHSDLDEPEIFFLYLDKNSAENDRITFFADKGITEINTSLKNFVYDTKINGSKQQKKLEEYQSIISRLNGRNLDLIKDNFEAQKNKDSLKLDTIQKQYDSNIKRKYLYTVNFAVNNKDSEVAPYLALTEIYNANINLLDTINNSLSPKIKNSKYGKKLQRYIDDIKTSETK